MRNGIGSSGVCSGDDGRDCPCEEENGEHGEAISRHCGFEKGGWLQ